MANIAFAALWLINMSNGDASLEEKAGKAERYLTQIVQAAILYGFSHQTITAGNVWETLVIPAPTDSNLPDKFKEKPTA